jgi:predicted RNase H-like nuclease (RuvC/YqgF family)
MPDEQPPLATGEHQPNLVQDLKDAMDATMAKWQAFWIKTMTLQAEYRALKIRLQDEKDLHSREAQALKDKLQKLEKELEDTKQKMENTAGVIDGTVVVSQIQAWEGLGRQINIADQGVEDTLRGVDL